MVVYVSMPAFYGHLRVLQQIVWKPAFWWLQERTRTPIISSWFFQENSTFSLSMPYLLPEFIITFPIEVHWIRETCVRKSRPKRFVNRAISVWTALFLFKKTQRQRYVEHTILRMICVILVHENPSSLFQKNVFIPSHFSRWLVMELTFSCVTR